jgi:hypothetical protein
MIFQTRIASFIAQSSNAARRRARRVQVLVGVLALSIVGGLVAWLNQARLLEQWRWMTVGRPYMLTEVRPHVLTAEAERFDRISVFVPPNSCTKSLHADTKKSGALPCAAHIANSLLIWCTPSMLIRSRPGTMLALCDYIILIRRSADEHRSGISEIRS